MGNAGAAKQSSGRRERIVAQREAGQRPRTGSRILIASGASDQPAPACTSVVKWLPGKL